MMVQTAKEATLEASMRHSKSLLEPCPPGRMPIRTAPASHFLPDHAGS